MEPKRGSGPRLKRLDSVVQLLTMESALLANALEEFSPDEEEEEKEEESSEYDLAPTHLEQVENHKPLPKAIPDIVLTQSPSPQPGSSKQHSQGQQEKGSPPRKPILKGPLHRTFTPLSLSEREAQEEDLRSEGFPASPVLHRLDESPVAPTTSQSLHAMGPHSPKTVRHKTPSLDLSHAALKVDSASGGGLGSRTRDESFCSLDRIPSEVFSMVVGQEPPKSDHVLVELGLDLTRSQDEQNSPSGSKSKSRSKKNTNQSNPSVPSQDTEETPPQQAVFTLEDEDASSQGSSSVAAVKRDFEMSVEEYFRTKVKDRRPSVSSVTGDKESFV